MEGTSAGAAAPPAGDAPLKSTLTSGPQRFLAYAIEHSLKCKRRSARDFIRHFPPATIMEGLEGEPQLRANIIVPTTGLKMKVALKKSAPSCGGDLQIALDEGETDADVVVSLFQPDDRVRFLDNRALWQFLIDGEFWQVDANKDPSAHETAAEHISYLIGRGLEDRLLTHRDVVLGITVETMTRLLPRADLSRVLEAALVLGQAKSPFVERDLLDTVDIATLAAHIPLSTIWRQVVVPFIAEAHGLVEQKRAVATPEKMPSPDPSNTQREPAEAHARPGTGTTKAVPASDNSKLPSASAASGKPASNGLPSIAKPRPTAKEAAPPRQAAPPKEPSPIASVLGEDDEGLDLEVDELLGSFPSEKSKRS